MTNITELKENEIFVFGSNLNGYHDGGAARTAVEKFGAIYGRPIGRQGQSYAIPTMDKEMNPLPLSEIQQHIELSLVEYAKMNPQITFYLTPIGTGIAGYTIGDLESILPELPANVLPTWR